MGTQGPVGLEVDGDAGVLLQPPEACAVLANLPQGQGLRRVTDQPAVECSSLDQQPFSARLQLTGIVSSELDKHPTVAAGEGRKDGATQRLSGRAPDNRLVHFAVPVGDDVPRPGDVVTVEVTYAAPHHLVADGAYGGVRRTRAGDAWELRSGRVPATGGVLLGMPRVGVPL